MSIASHWADFTAAWDAGEPEAIEATANALLQADGCPAYARAEAHFALTGIALDAGDGDAVDAHARQAMEALDDVTHSDARGRIAARLLMMLSRSADELLKQDAVRAVADAGAARRAQRRDAAKALAEAEALRRLVPEAGEKQAVHDRALERAEAAWNAARQTADARLMHAAQTLRASLD